MITSIVIPGRRPELIAILLVFFWAAMADLSAIAGGRVALVYGNSDYQNAPKLANPVNDAALITSSLKQVGFNVISITDGDQAAMQKGLEDFGRASQNADIALFYFAGHGLQVGGRNWLIPVDANIESSTDLPARAISANTVLELMELSGAKARIAVLDACRNNPLSRSLTRASTRGLARIDSTAAGSMIIFATAPGDVALDGTGANSPFSKALARQILEPGLEIRQMMGRVRADVMADTDDKQVPWVNEAIVGEIYLAAAPTGGSDTLDTRTDTPSPQTGNAGNTALEIAFWESVKNSGDADLLQLYIDRYPGGVFIEIARARIAKLNSAPPTTSLPSTSAPAQRNSSENTQQALLSDNRSITRQNEMENAARKFIRDLQFVSSADAGQYFNAIPQYYSEFVSFYGKYFSVEQILGDKRSFVKRWPQRRYNLRDQQIDVFCSLQNNQCNVEGIVDWEVQNPRKRKYISGVSRLNYKIEFFRSGPRVIFEDGQVLQRNQ